MPQNIPAFFDSYADLYNRALAGEDVFEEIMDRFSDKFLAAGPGNLSSPSRAALSAGYWKRAIASIARSARGR